MGTSSELAFPNRSLGTRRYPEFTRRNLIAVEVEKVIDALVSLAFNRDSFLRSLDRFYRAIEDAAHPYPLVPKLLFGNVLS